jgi:hypothetical protein
VPAFASVSELENHLQRQLTPEQVDGAEQALELATGLIQSYTGQHLFPGTSVETFPAPPTFGAYGGVLVMRQRPVTAVTSITVNGEPETTFTIDGPAGIVRVMRTDPVTVTSWPSWFRPTVEVDYEHGFQVPPPILKAVCLEVARQVVDNPKGFAQMSVGDVSGTYGAHADAGVGLMLTGRHERILSRL